RFDFERMSRLALGRHWRKASEQQRQAFVAAFRQLLVRTYATALLNYSDEQIVYKPLRQEPTGKEAVVNTLVSEPGGAPVPIDYRLHLGSDGHWRVYDVIVDGVSLVSNYRSSFGSEIRRRGMDGLIRKLETMGGQEVK
ncbi:MAG TPA: ABC transporter substrate-binding protein, partial [Sedimenticola thiotaurini]|nr:ABC transporter substrate-binding protein [Sedimenticola thiotaurini]